MSNQAIAALTAVGNGVDWQRKDLNLQAIIEAGNKGKLGKPLTDWLASRGWETSAAKSSALVTPKDLDWWLNRTEAFFGKHLDIQVDLRKEFAIPTELPWGSVIPVFDPGTFTNRDVFNILKTLGLNPWEEPDVMKCAGSEKSGKPTLHFIENSKKPNEDTMEKSPNDLRRTGKLYLRLRGYALAMAIYHFATGEYLDPETFTCFPEDCFPDGLVARGCWHPGALKVRFYLYNAANRYSGGGARIATPVPLVT